MKIIVIALAVAVSGFAQAQDFKLAKSTGRLEIYIGKVTVEGYSGNEIVFSSQDRHEEKDDRAAGLKAINSLGLEDNTGLGINVADKGNLVEVRQLKKIDAPAIKIMVPKGVVVFYSHDSQYGGDATFKNLENEIEISANYNSVDLENITGPATIKSVYGHVEASFAANVKGPISIVSVYGYVDVTLPVATKANVKLTTSHGEILVAPEFKLEVEKQGELIHYNGDKVIGKINGGGMNLDLNSGYSKIYLRKK